MATRLTQASFTRGELTPRLDSRTNLEQYAIGLKRAKNAIIHQEGGISNRMGLEFCGVAKYKDKHTRVMKFVFNSEQTYMLEFGEHYIRFIKDGGYVVFPNSHQKAGQIVEVETPYSAEDLSTLKRSQAGDILTLTHPNYPVKNLSRYAHHDWRLENAVFEPNIAAPTNVKATWSGANTNPKSYEYLVTAVEDESNEESRRSDIVNVTGRREANWAVGEYMTITWDAVAGACEYNVYRSVNGIFGYIGTAQGTSFVDDNIEPDLSSSAPISRNPFNENNPSCSCYYQQRKMYANSLNNPQTLWTSQTGAVNNFNVSRPLIATDAITLNMDDREVNEIRHLIPMKDLIVLTSNSEWKVNGADGTFQANPTPASVIQSYYGSSHVEPVVSGSMVIFVQAGGSVIRDLGWDIYSEGYDGDELSLFSSHLFEGKTISYMAYAKEPYRLLYVIFNDGSGAIMTYNKKQKLCGWTTLETKGKLESVDVVREGLEDVAYFVINRIVKMSYFDAGNLDDIAVDYFDAGTLDDAAVDYVDAGTLEHSQDGEVFTETKYIERTKTRIIDDTKKAFLVDCGLAAEFSKPKTVITGLEHLEGETVIANVNGGIVKNLVVKDGKITLEKPASTIVVGLPYEFEFETLNLEGENTQGLKKIINHVCVKVFKSREDFIFCGENMDFRHIRCDESINNSGALFSKDLSMTVLSEPKSDATIKLKQDYPLPLTILSVSASVDVQDNENN